MSPAASVSVIECVAKHGYYGTPAQECPRGMFCPGNTMQPIPCAVVNMCGSVNNEQMQNILSTIDYIIITTWASLLLLFFCCIMGGYKLFVMKKAKPVNTIHMMI